MTGVVLKIAFASVLALGLSSCGSGPERHTEGGQARGDDVRFNLWPLLRLESEQEKHERRAEALWPIIERRESPTFAEFYLRPIYNRRTDKFLRITESDWVWPLGFGTDRPDLDRQVIFPLFLHENGTESDGTPESRTILLPLLYQRSGKGPSDLLIFPFGGVIHDFLDREKIVIALWPLYVYQRGREASDWSFLHPVFSYIRWDDGGHGYKAWPLFGINRRPDDKLFKLFILWPIFNYDKVVLPQGTIRAWAFWPFYSEETGPSGWDWSIAWPLFTRHYEKGETQTWFPWLLEGRLSGEKVSGWTFWPAFSITSRPERTSGYYLWPFGWFSSQSGKDEAFSFRLMPLMFYERETRRRTTPTMLSGSPFGSDSWAGASGNPAAGEGPWIESSGAWQAWPLVKYRHDADGASHVEVPSIFPARWYAPWERNFAPFFRIFEYEHESDGTTSWRALWRLARVESGPTRSAVELAPLFRVYEKDATGESGWSFLMGLVATDRAPEGRTWRLFYFIKF